MFWLRTFHKVMIKMLAGAAVSEGLPGLEGPKIAVGRPQVLPHVGLSKGLLTTGL